MPYQTGEGGTPAVRSDQVEARRRPAAALRRLLRRADRKQGLQHVRRAPAVTTRRQLLEPLSAERRDELRRECVADRRHAPIDKPHVAVAVDESQGRDMAVTARKL